MGWDSHTADLGYNGARTCQLDMLVEWVQGNIGTANNNAY